MPGEGVVDELLVRIGVEAEGLISGLNAASNAISQEGDELQRLENQHANLNKRLDLTSDAYHRQVKIVDELKRRIEQGNTGYGRHHMTIERLQQELHKAEVKQNQLAASFDKTYDAIQRTEGKMRDMVQRTKQATDETAKLEQENSKLQESYMILAGVGTAAFLAIVAAVKEGIQEYNNYRSALVGLKSIAEGTGNSFSDVKAEIQDFISDGLVPAGDAATAFKNLLARGFNTDEAVAMLKRFKDAASFGRQGALSLGEAVRSATEGIKNENSILVDNAGVTKNVSKMWQEYATSIGKTVNDLTIAEKRTAEFNGIMEETRFQVGDASKYAAEFAGTQAMLGAETTKLSVAFGEAMAPAVQGLMEIVIAIIRPITDFIKNNQTLVSVLTSVIAVVVGAIAVLAGIKVATGLWAKFVGTMALTGPAAGSAAAGITGVGVASKGAAVGVGILKTALDLLAAHPIILALTILVAVTMAVVSAIKSHAEAERKAVEQAKERAATLGDQRRELQALAKEYDELSKNTRRTAEQTERMAKIERDMVAVYGASANAIDGQGQAIARGNAIIEERIRLLREEELIEQKKIVDAAVKSAMEISKSLVEGGLTYQEAMDQAVEILNNSASVEQFFAKEIERVAGSADLLPSTVRNILNDLSETIDGGAGTVEEKKAEFSTALNDFFKDVDLQAAFDELDIAQLNAFDDSISGLTSYQTALQNALTKVQGLTGVSQTLKDTMKNQLNKELENTTRRIDNLNAAAVRQNKTLKAVDQIYEDLADGAKKMKAIDGIINSFQQLGYQKQAVETLKAAEKGTKEFDKALEELSKATGLSEETILSIEDLDEITAGTEQDLIALYNQLLAMSGVNPDAGNITQQLNRIAGDSNNANAAVAALVLQLQSLTNVKIDPTTGKATGVGPVTRKGGSSRGGGGGGKKTSKYDKALEEMEYKKSLDQMTLEQEVATLEKIKKQHAKSAQQKKDIEVRLHEARKALQEKQLNDAIAHINHEVAMDRMSKEQELKNLRDVFANFAKTEEQKRELLERMHSLEKEIQEERLNNAVRLVDHNKNMGRLTLEQEKNALEEILRTHQLTTDQRMDLEERLYAVIEAWNDKQYSDAKRLIDYKVRMGRMELEEQIEQLKTLLREAELSAEERMDLEETIFDLEKSLQQKRFEAKLQEISKLKDFNILRLEDEIAMLEQILLWEELTAEQRYDIEKSLHDTRKSLLARQSNEIDQLADALTKALQEKYRTQQKIEQDAIKDSINNWKQWEKDTVKAIKDAAKARIDAINDQIDALDKLLKQEEEADVDAEERRKIAAIQAQIEFEHNAENKAQLQKELEKLEKDRANRLRRLEIEAQKEALKEQIDLVKQQAEAEEEAAKQKAETEQETLQQRLDEVNKFYEGRLNALRIQGEVEQMLIAQNQEAILDLLQQYNPEYNATGKSLGQRFAEGFGEALNPLLEAIDLINTQFDVAQRQIIESVYSPNTLVQAMQGANKALVIDFQKALEAKQTAANIELNREYHFHQEVESPYEIRRAVEKTDEDLVALFGGL